MHRESPAPREGRTQAGAPLASYTPRPPEAGGAKQREAAPARAVPRKAVITTVSRGKAADPVPENNAGGGRPRQNAAKAALAAGALCLVLAAVMAPSWMSADAGDGHRDAQPDAAQDTDTRIQAAEVAAASSGHAHSWEPVMATLHREAETATVALPAVYEDAIEYHTLCNTCMAQIDGKTEEHFAENPGHAGYTTGAAVVVTREVVPERTEEQVVQDAKDEEVVAYEKCAGCGETRNLNPELAGQSPR